MRNSSPAEEIWRSAHGDDSALVSYPARAASSSANPTAYIPALDGVRGLAILLVLLFHQNLLQRSGFETIDAKILSFVAGVGWCGVNLFFVLSGFLITRILYGTKDQAGYFRKFYFRRFVRIFPLYYAVLFLTFVVLPTLTSAVVPPEKLERLTDAQGNSLWYWLYLSNFSIAAVGAWGPGILDVAWSLSIEEQFYLVWPAVVRFTNRKELMRLCLSLMALAFGIRTAMTVADVNPVSIYVLTPSQLDVIAAGAFVALAAEGPGGIPALLPRAIRIWSITTAFLTPMFAWRGTSNMDPVVQTVGFSLLAVNFSSLLVFALGLHGSNALVRFFSSPVMRAFGKYSYALYLFHMPVRGLVRDALYGPDRFLTFLGSRLPGQLLFYALATGLTFIAAYASWHLYEKHFLKLKRFAPFEPKSPVRDPLPAEGTRSPESSAGTPVGSVALPDARRPSR